MSAPEIPCNGRPYRVLGLAIILLTFGLLLAWAWLAPLQSAVVAEGRISVASQNKTVQHLDGGLVTRLEVQDGDQVEKGQLLLTLDTEELRIRREQVTGQLLETRAELERLGAERRDRDELVYSVELLGEAADPIGKEILDTQRQLFRSRREALLSEQNVLRQRVLQAERQIDGADQLIRSLKRRISLLNDDLSGLRKLAKGNMTSRTKLREIEGRRVELEGEIVTQEGEMGRLREAIAENRFQIALRSKEYKREVVTRQQALQRQRIDLKADLRGIDERLGRSEIRAPVSGKVKGFEVVTIGAVISAGKPIMEIVPRDQAFRIDARVSPLDIDAVYPGLKAEIRLTAFDKHQMFPSLFAMLEDVSTDAFEDRQQRSDYYKATLNMDDDSRSVLSSRDLKLVSGMPVEVIINTGQRTLIEYLVQPLRDMLARAFNEA